jgi:uncharacterized protein (TIGR02300 family)
VEDDLADLKGLKRICMSCGARFYDLNKKPIVCPSCSTEFTGEIKVKSRRGRLPADIAGSQVDEDTEAVIDNDEPETEEIEQDEELVSLEEIEDGDDDDIAEDDDDLDIDDDLEIDEDLDDLDEDEDIEEDEEDK